MRFDSLLPPEAVRDTPRFVLTGRNQLLIEGHKGLLHCEDESISVHIPKGTLMINGTHLSIASLGTQDMIICGNICRLEFLP